MSRLTCGEFAMSRRIATEDEAVEFIRRARFALRYNSTPTLPLASMYGAAGDQRLAIELTNILLAREEVVEPMSLRIGWSSFIGRSCPLSMFCASDFALQSCLSLPTKLFA